MEGEPTVGDMMAAYAEDAVDHAQAAAGIALDYSQESIRNVRARDLLKRGRRPAPAAQADA